jgi:murein DD-endopeptidase MepM/ murein hydrolase activator NlpD
MKKWFLTIAAVCVLMLGVGAAAVHAQTADDIQKQIDQHNAQIDSLDKEINQYQQQLQIVSTQKQTVQSQLSQINLSKKKVTASISQTQNKIGATQLQLQQLASQIQTKQQTINADESAVGESLRSLDRIESDPLFIHILSDNNVGDAWRDIDSDLVLQQAVRDHISSLSQDKASLTVVASSTQQKKTQLVVQQKTLVVQKGSLDATAQAEADLLKQTKARETTYQNLITQKKAAKASFESALSDLNAKLQYVVNPSSITPKGKGVVQYPVDHVVITQYFGDTAFAATGAYNGKGHNGVDFGVPIGTPIKAALTGTIAGTGNTDAVKGCYSFGKWVLIKHGNGLDTMYGHLSKISVTAGQTVSTGDVIGYSGETGYATGPHLHFGVYDTAATQIMKLGDATKSKTPCAGAVMPVAPLSGYLNPISYLP